MHLVTNDDAGSINGNPIISQTDMHQLPEDSVTGPVEEPANPEESAGVRQRDGLVSSHKPMDILKKVCPFGSETIVENIGKGDVWQIMVSTDGRPLRGKTQAMGE